MGDVRRIIHSKANTNQKVDGGHAADGHVPEVHVAQSVDNRQSDAQHHPNRDPRIRHQGEDHDQDHTAANCKVPHQLSVNDAHLFPVQEVEAVWEGTSVESIHLAAHGGHGDVSVGAPVRGRQGQLRVEARGCQSFCRDAASRNSIHVGIHLAVLVIPFNGVAVAGSHGIAVPQMQRGVELCLVCEYGLGVAARGREGVTLGSGLVRGGSPLHELHVPAVHHRIVIDEVAGVQVSIDIIEIALLVVHVRRHGEVHSNGRACGEVLTIDVEEGVHIRGVGDEPFQLEILVDLSASIDPDPRDDGEDDEGHNLAHWLRHLLGKADQAFLNEASLQHLLGQAAAAASLRVIRRPL
mmetsp:Transcript_43255/g.103069  ORF Transcript_43255/g.103069 Transcript_43255/m.103069 type:complete len:352 (-) Transcript_43255:1009-2064(-)